MNLTASDLQRMADQAADAEAAGTIESVCRIVDVGVRAVQSRERSAETVKRRAVVAWILRDRLSWPMPKVAKALNRTERQVFRLLQMERP